VLFGEVVTPVTVMMRRRTVMMSGGLMVGRSVEMVFTGWMGRRCRHLHPLSLQVSSAASDEERTELNAPRNDTTPSSFRSRKTKRWFAYRRMFCAR
jgi:hypothetical protein